MNKFILKFKLLLIILILSITSYINAQTIILDVENDVLVNEDYDYTHGTIITYIGNPIFPKSIFDFIMKEEVYSIQHSIFQFIYTPEHIDVAELQPNDRPWAGWSGYQNLSSYQNDKRNIKLGYQIGIIGPYSYSENSQKTIHEWIDSTEPLGWANQIDTHLALNVLGEYQYRLVDRKNYDLTGSTYSLLGTSHVLGGVSLLNRIGWNIPDGFDDISAEPIPRGTRGFFNKASIYLLGGVDSRYIAYNALFDEADEYNIEKKNFVTDMSLGMGFRYSNLRLIYKYVWRTKEFDGDEKIKAFGTISISWDF